MKMKWCTWDFQACFRGLKRSLFKYVNADTQFWLVSRVWYCLITSVYADMFTGATVHAYMHVINKYFFIMWWWRSLYRHLSSARCNTCLICQFAYLRTCVRMFLASVLFDLKWFHVCFAVNETWRSTGLPVALWVKLNHESFFRGFLKATGWPTHFIPLLYFLCWYKVSVRKAATFLNEMKLHSKIANKFHLIREVFRSRDKCLMSDDCWWKAMLMHSSFSLVCFIRVDAHVETARGVTVSSHLRYSWCNGTVTLCAVYNHIINHTLCRFYMFVVLFYTFLMEMKHKLLRSVKVKNITDESHEMLKGSRCK